MSIQGTPVQFQVLNDADGSFTVTVTGVQAGESLFVQLSAFAPSLATLGASDDRSNTWNVYGPSTAQNSGIAANYAAFGCAAGDTIITLSGFGAGVYVEGVAYRRNDTFPGGASSHDSAASASANAVSSTPSVTGASAPAQDDNIVNATVAVSDASSNVGLDVPATTGYTNLKVHQDANTSIGHSSDYKEISNGTSGAQSAAWGTLAGGADDWSARIDVFKITADTTINIERGHLVLRGKDVGMDAPAPQTLNPTADVSVGGWAPSAGGSPTELWPMLDESSPDDGDYIYAEQASLCEVALAPAGDPQTNVGHVLRYRIKQISGGTSITVRLVQPGSPGVIAEWVETVAGTYERQLSEAQAASINDYADLRVQFESA